MMVFASLQTASGLFQELDDRINYVATKVVHLGDQLEGINTPRSRAIEAQELMKYFDEFANGKLVSSVFKDHYQVSMTECRNRGAALGNTISLIMQ